MLTHKCLVLVFTFCCVTAKELPSYIKPCRLADPNFEECAVQNGNDAIASIIKGDKNLKVVSHVPLIIPEVVLQATAGLVIKLRNVSMNFEGAKLSSFKLDPVEKSLKFNVINDFAFDGFYEMNGRILLIPLSGNGPFNSSLDREDIEYSATYDLVRRNGKDYMGILKEDIRSTNTKAGFYFDNLFNGNKQLGEQINKVLNDNWKQFQEEFRPAVKQIWKSIFHKVVATYLTMAPFKELFL